MMNLTTLCWSLTQIPTIYTVAEILMQQNVKKFKGYEYVYIVKHTFV